MEDLTSLVNETQSCVVEWTQEVLKLQKNHSWLVYFNMPKLLLLHRLLCSLQTEKIVHEVSFLAHNQTAKLKERAEVLTN